MGLDIITKVGFGAILPVSEELTARLAALLAEVNPDAEASDFLPEVLEGLYAAYPLLSLQSNYDEDSGTESFFVFLRSTTSSADKYDSMAPRLLRDSDITPEEGVALRNFLSSIVTNLPEVGWWVTKLIF
jgi:hypothetical protein